MNDTVWYYVDRGGQRQGPVTAAAVAEAWRAGQANDASLAWREGMAEWMPLAGFHAELGLAGVPASAAVHSAPVGSPTAPPAALPAPQKSNKGCLIAGLVGGALFLLFVVGILVAIALPAYQDYVERAKEMADDPIADEIPADGMPADGTADSDGSMDSGILAMAFAEARQHQGLVDDFVANTDRCPRDGTEVAVPPAVTPGVVAITVGEARTGMCTIEVELGGIGAESLAGERLTLSRDVAGDWYCTSEMTRREVLPEECR